MVTFLKHWQRVTRSGSSDSAIPRKLIKRWISYSARGSSFFFFLSTFIWENMVSESLRSSPNCKLFATAAKAVGLCLALVAFSHFPYLAGYIMRAPQSRPERSLDFRPSPVPLQTGFSLARKSFAKGGTSQDSLNSYYSSKPEYILVHCTEYGERTTVWKISMNMHQSMRNGQWYIVIYNSLLTPETESHTIHLDDGVHCYLITNSYALRLMLNAEIAGFSRSTMQSEMN